MKEKHDFGRLRKECSDAIKKVRSALLIFFGHKKPRRRRFGTSTAVRVAGGECARCKTNQNLTLDHIRPRSLGGSNKSKNLQVLCRRCNQLKGTQTTDYRKIKTGVMHVPIGERVKHG